MKLFCRHEYVQIGRYDLEEMDGDGAGKLAKRKFRLYSILRIPEVAK